MTAYATDRWTKAIENHLDRVLSFPRSCPRAGNALGDIVKGSCICLG